MGQLSVRQGDSLFFARSLVWKVTAVSIPENLDHLSEAERYERFLSAWERHLRAGLDPSQAEADRVAAMFNVKANIAPPRPSGVRVTKLGLY